MNVTEQIDRLIHDAQHADSGANFAQMIGHTGPAKEMRQKRDRLLKEARYLHAQNPDSRWPDPEDCEWASQ